MQGSHILIGSKREEKKEKGKKIGYLIHFILLSKLNLSPYPPNLTPPFSATFLFHKSCPLSSIPLTTLQPKYIRFSSVEFSHSVVSDSLRPHESQHARPPCPSPTPRVNQTHVHRVGDAIQPSHPLSSPSSPAPNPSQHQSIFQWVNSLHEVAKVLEFQL